MFPYLDLGIVAGLLLPPLIGAISVRLADRLRNRNALFGGISAAVVATLPASICAAIVWSGAIAGVDAFIAQLGHDHAPGLIMVLGLIGLQTMYLMLVGVMAGTIAYYRHRHWETSIEAGYED